MLNGIANQACDAGDESCADIVDARERKRIQNRIAQRTYRQKLKKRIEALEYWRDSAAAGTQIDSQVLIQPICEISDKASLHEDRRKQNPNLRTGSQGPLGTRGKQYCAAVTPPSPMSSSKQTYENVIHDRPISTSNTYITPIDDRSADMQHLSSPAVQPMSMSLTPLINANLSIKDFAEETNLTDAEKNRVTQNIIWEKLVGEVTQVEDNFRVPPFQTRPEEYQSQVQTEIGLLRPEPEVTDEQGSTLSAESHRGKTPLHLAAESGHQSSVRMLLDRMLDIHAQDSSGCTALHLAVKNKHEEVVQAILAWPRWHDNDPLAINIQDHEGHTALHMAVMTGQEALVNRLLLAPQVELEVKDFQGSTALHLAIIRQCDKVIQLLLDNNADLNARIG